MVNSLTHKKLWIATKSIEIALQLSPSSSHAWKTGNETAKSHRKWIFTFYSICLFYFLENLLLTECRRMSIVKEQHESPAELPKHELRSQNHQCLQRSQSFFPSNPLRETFFVKSCPFNWKQDVFWWRCQSQKRDAIAPNFFTLCMIRSPFRHREERRLPFLLEFDLLSRDGMRFRLKPVQDGSARDRCGNN